MSSATQFNPQTGTGLRVLLQEVRKPHYSDNEPRLREDSLETFGFSPDDAATIIGYIDQLIKLGNDFTVDQIFGELPEESKDPEKIKRFTVLLNDLHRFYAICKQATAVKSQSLDGGEYKAAGETIMGHWRGSSTNSDCIYIADDSSEDRDPNKPRVVAVVADGVTGSGADKLNQTGRFASRAFVDFFKTEESQKIIQDLFKFEICDKQKFTDFQNKDIDLDTKIEDLLWDIHQESGVDFLDNFQRRPGKFLNKKLRLYLEEIMFLGTSLSDEFTLLNTYKTLFDSEIAGLSDEQIKEKATQFYRETSLENLLSQIFIDDYQLRYKVAGLLESAKTNINIQAHQILEKGLIEDFENMGTTASLAIETKDEFILVDVGDSRSFAFDDDGVIKSTANTLHVNHKGQPTSLIVVSKRINSAGEVQIRNRSTSEISIRRVPKSQVKGLMLLTDGVCHDKFDELGSLISSMPKQQKDPSTYIQGAFQLANKVNTGDDMSAIAILKQ